MPSRRVIKSSMVIVNISLCNYADFFLIADNFFYTCVLSIYLGGCIHSHGGLTKETDLAAQVCAI